VEQNSLDTSGTLYKKVTDIEIDLAKQHINTILTNSYKTTKPENEGNLFLKSDFNALCELDLEKQTTMREAINLLRALTHDDYKNAYFFDQNGKKIYVSINLNYE
jgi:hypothetical protein